MAYQHTARGSALLGMVLAAHLGLALAPGATRPAPSTWATPIATLGLPVSSASVIGLNTPPSCNVCILEYRCCDWQWPCPGWGGGGLSPALGVVLAGWLLLRRLRMPRHLKIVHCSCTCCTAYCTSCLPPLSDLQGTQRCCCGCCWVAASCLLLGPTAGPLPGHGDEVSPAASCCLLLLARCAAGCSVSHCHSAHAILRPTHCQVPCPASPVREPCQQGRRL
jgi:hypothetical protein